MRERLALHSPNKLSTYCSGNGRGIREISKLQLTNFISCKSTVTIRKGSFEKEL